MNIVLRKDVRLPVQLQRAMAAEAEAAREARAKVGMNITNGYCVLCSYFCPCFLVSEWSEITFSLGQIGRLICLV